PANHELIAQLRDLGLRMDADADDRPGPLAGKVFVITGTLGMGPREAVHERIRSLGGLTTDAVTRRTSYLVVGADPGLAKVTKAEKLGVPVITEADLVAMLTGNGGPE
ncbi:MAG TPA: NAD-dependent DNA ligase LigA, partial [Candidatus Hydrogenedentes bacterium]|nr:NAD-dependent DNA ligase LigA [Candidatus Hydrogenedentota bacterium]